MATLRYMLRPAKFLTTPKKLAEACGVEKIFRYPRRLRTPYPLFDTDRDLILSWPDPAMFADADTRVKELCEFYNKNKRDQRKYLSEVMGLSVPDDHHAYRNKWVIRPLRHFGGADFVVADGCIRTYSVDTHYADPLFERTHEYRIIISRGVPVVTLAKTLPEGGLAQEVPWNHAAGCRFVTIDHAASMLWRNTPFYTYIGESSLFRTVHLCGLDVMFNKRNNTYCVTEVNFAPGITIQNNIDAIASWLMSEDGVHPLAPGASSYTVGVEDLPDVLDDDYYEDFDPEHYPEDDGE